MSILNTSQNIFGAIKRQIESRHFFKWLIIVFNGVDRHRIEKVGPDRTCAEWLLRNGAAIKWSSANEYLYNYNLLPDEKSKLNLQKVDATDSAIHHIGFEHFSGCKYIDEIKLVKCSYIENEALSFLSILKDTLHYLEVTDCKNITDEGLLELKNLRYLKSLKLGNMPYVKNKNNVVSKLTLELPNCKITYSG